MVHEQNWQTEAYRGFDVHVAAISHDASSTKWDYTVRVAHPGDDASSESEITAQSGDDADYASAELAVEAGFAKGYAMVDALFD